MLKGINTHPLVLFKKIHKSFSPLYQHQKISVKVYLSVALYGKQGDCSWINLDL